MKKVFATLSSLLVLMGLRAQAQVPVKKETTPQVKPATTMNPKLKDPAIKDPHSIKYGVADSMKEAGIKHEGIKNANIKDATIKDIKEIKDIKAIKESPATIKQAHIKK